MNMANIQCTVTAYLYKTKKKSLLYPTKILYICYLNPDLFICDVLHLGNVEIKIKFKKNNEQKGRGEKILVSESVSCVVGESTESLHCAW